MSSLETKFTNECQIRMKWKIKEEDVRNIEESLDSDTFASKIPGVKYYLEFCRKGEPENEYNVYLQLQFEMTKKIIATFTVSVKSASSKFNIVDQDYDESDDGWGKSICTHEELFNPEKKFFVNGIMEIELEGTLKSQGIKRKADQPLSLAKVLWENDKEKDLTITVEDQQIKIHKWVLCANSAVFEKELKPAARRAAKKKIDIADFTFNTVKIAVEYCYEQDIKDQINDENASELLHFSYKYNIQPLHDLIQNVLIEKISETNVCKFANISVENEAAEIREYCICFLMKFVGKNTVIDGFKDLNAEITDEIGRRCLFSSSE